MRKRLLSAIAAVAIVAGCASPEPASTLRSPAAGVFFDAFRYRSATDPLLGAHGWAVRTGQGAPGPPGATWSASGVSFPGGQGLTLTANTDGTADGTSQAELDTKAQKFFQGTYAARVRFSDSPASGPGGDPVVQTFYTISPLDRCDDPRYSEQDFEYLPDGGWGAAGPRMYTTTWHTYCESPFSRDARETSVPKSLNGWHTLVLTIADGTVTYYVDGTQYGSSAGRYYPRQPMTIDFNLWFNAESQGHTRSTWTEQVAWVYYASGQTLTTAQVQANVQALTASGSAYQDTVGR
jgi:hypothetical protein